MPRDNNGACASKTPPGYLKRLLQLTQYGRLNDAQHGSEDICAAKVGVARGGYSQPISDWWAWDGTGTGRCINRDRVNWTFAIISIVLDVWMMAIPLWNIRDLKLHWKKLGAAAMFLVGALTTIVSCVRLKFLADIPSSSNPTQVLFDIIRWSTVECFTSVACACMLVFRLMLDGLFPKAFGTGSRNKSKGSSGRSRYDKNVSTGQPYSGPIYLGPTTFSVRSELAGDGKRIQPGPYWAVNSTSDLQGNPSQTRGDEEGLPLELLESQGGNDVRRY
ncbi:hypothetical protein QBC44DRAFT_362408 [Cladorrhinum sp. PSN332]|nr:hypothetical protein QBC44DRAFT_362408 [Cladorrhinum sp. PSN332]